MENTAKIKKHTTNKHVSHSIATIMEMFLLFDLTHAFHQDAAKIEHRSLLRHFSFPKSKRKDASFHVNSTRKRPRYNNKGLPESSP